LLAVGIAAVAVNLRCAVTSLGAVLGQLTDDWRLSGLAAGLLTSLPVATFALVGALAGRLARRLGTERTVAAAMALTALGLIGRTLAGSVPVFVADSVLALSGAALGNVLLPVLVKRHFPDRLGAITALYTTALALGMTGGAGLTVPVERLLGGSWRAGLAVWAVPAAVAVLPWLVVTRDTVRGEARSPARPVRGLRRSATSAALTLFFGCQSLNAYVVLGWLPAILAGSGLDAQAAGLPLALVGALSVPMSLVLPRLAARRPGQHRLVLLTTVAYAAGYLGLLYAPAALPWLWAALLGVGNGAFPLSVTLIGLRTRRAEVTAALSTLAQSGGYLIAALGPLAVGLLRQSSGGWALPLLAALATLPVQLVAGARAASIRLIDDELGLAEPNRANPANMIKAS
jgi:CP family cyanate transporter-like MFS transporter